MVQPARGIGPLEGPWCFESTVGSHTTVRLSLVTRDHERPRTTPLEVDVGPLGDLLEVISGQVRDVDDTDRFDRRGMALLWTRL